MEFILGCNYWASNAGADMWRFFDENVIRKDIAILAEHGIKYMRVFPNWRDFQPVEPMTSEFGKVVDYFMTGDTLPTNPYYLDDTMMDRFGIFLDICKEYNVKIIVGLITGWMSGRLYTPPAFFGKNVITDPTAQYFEQLFIKGFIERFKDYDIIYAWDLGNECNSMASADRINAVNWTAMMSNAIKSADPTRPVISGMHSLREERNHSWRITDQAMYNDMLTTHPYPYWINHANVDGQLSVRGTMHATAETKMYAEIGNKPCMAEEIGAMGPSVSSNENAANFIRLNMFSMLANDATGLMWWCAHEQTMIDAYPYSENMVELELGMIDADYNPKPVLKEMKKFSEFLDNTDLTLTESYKDAVCILTHGQDTWGAGYMTHNLLRKTGLNCRFTFADNELPESELYIMPSINGHHIMHKEKYKELRQRVYDGADLYISNDNGILAEFESLTGLKPIDSSKHLHHGTIDFNGCDIDFSRGRNFTMEPTTAEVIVCDNEGNPAVSVNRYGKGRVFYVNFPLEINMTDEADSLDKNRHVIYKSLFDKYIEKHPVTTGEEDVIATYHYTDNGVVVVFINHSENPKKLQLSVKDGYSVKTVYYGSEDEIKPYDACIIEYKK